MSTAALHQPLYHLKSKDTVIVDKVLQLLDGEAEQYGIVSYDVLGTSIEDIFLELMKKEGLNEYGVAEVEKSSSSGSMDEVSKPVALNLATGRATSPLSQTLTIFRKRCIIVRRSWLTPFLAVVIAICGATIPLIFFKDRPASCVKTLDIPATDIALYPPESPLSEFFFGVTLVSPPGIISTLGNTTGLGHFNVTDLPDNATFISTIRQNFTNIEIGGVSFDLASGSALVAYESNPPGLLGLTMLNLASNVLYNNALNTSGRAGNAPALILPNYQSFPPVDGAFSNNSSSRFFSLMLACSAGTLVGLKWIAFFGAAMVRWFSSPRLQS
jgi:hypothetical protein